MYHKKTRILKFILLITSIVWISRVSLVAQVTVVYAGEDSGVCNNESFDLSLLDASISGIVSDGDWLSSGDGVFQPDNSGNGQFSVSTHYHPGSFDFQNGGFELTLASDPDPGNGNIYIDKVFIHLLNDVQPFCNGSLNVSLNSDCVTVIGYEELVVNPNMPVDLFDVVLQDEHGHIIPGDSLTYEHIGETIEYVVTHSCSGQSCGGWITVDDHYVPVPVCKDTVLSCLFDIVPDSLGFPVLTDSIPYLIDEHTYLAELGDNCSDLTMKYYDNVDIQSCSSQYERIIERHWTVFDENGNTNHCTQYIYLERAALSDINFPEDRDGVAGEVVACDFNMLVDENGNPLPIVTGSPDAMNCQFLESTYDDLTIDFCGATKKIIRTWHIIEWCSNATMMHNQIIVTADTMAPMIICVDTMYLETSPYSCETDDAYLTVPLASDACSDHSISLKVFDQSDLIQTSYDIQEPFVHVPNLPLGAYELHWIAEDACSNDTICVSHLEVIDKTLPFMVCLQETQVAIGDTGLIRMYPESADLGSYDNCELSTLELRRISNQCNGDTVFGPYVEFCCEDVGDTVMVILKATDHVGMVNYCEVVVYVEDKLPPVLLCPTDLTISCEAWYSTTDFQVFGSIQSSQDSIEDIILSDAYNNGVAGQDGYYLDNCEATVTEEIVEDFECNEGLVQRIFRATDNSGNVDSCIQYIQVLNSMPLTYDKIVWPENIEIDTCENIDLDSNIFGEPTWGTGLCSMVAYTYEDEVFEFATDACVKVIRNYSLIDWCQYDQNTGAGIWNYEQIIKFSNDIAPEFLTPCDSIEVCIYEACGEEISFSANAMDDCTLTEEIQYNYKVDFDDDGSIEFFGDGNTFDQYVEPGIVSIVWQAWDKCGNIVECEQIVTVKDCKLPSPYCLGSFTTSIGNDGLAHIWATDIDLGGTDNCTDDLILSFSDTTIINSISFSCDSLENGISQAFMVDLWYFDEAGNKEYCSTEVIIQDNLDYCPNGNFLGTITGNVTSTTGAGISQVEIGLSADNESYNQTTISQLGAYEFDELISDIDYTISCDKEDSWLSGVSTLDIIRIQNHILGKIALPTGYDIRGADVDISGSVSAIDLITIRRLILGKIESFPNADSPWLFVGKDDELSNINPWALSSEIDVDLVGEINLIDIKGIKLGDANVSATVNATSQEIDSRTNQDLYFQLTEVNGHYQYDFYLEDITSFIGLECYLNLGPNQTDIRVHSSTLINLNEENYHVSKSGLNLSWNGSQTTNSSAEPLFSIQSSDLLDLSLNPYRTSNLIENNEQQRKFDQLSKFGVDLHEDCEINLNWNLYSQTIQVESNLTLNETLEFQLFDLSGMYIYGGSTKVLHSNQEIDLTEINNLTSGAYVFYLKSGSCHASEIISIVAE